MRPTATAGWPRCSRPTPPAPHLFALYAFNAEVARIGDHVSQPILGDIRLQWWIDALKGERAGEVLANPTAAALLETIEKFDLPREKLLDLLEARRLRFLRRSGAGSGISG